MQYRSKWYGTSILGSWNSHWWKVIGGLEHFYFPYYMGCHPSHWLICFKMVKSTNHCSSRHFFWFTCELVIASCRKSMVLPAAMVPVLCTWQQRLVILKFSSCYWTMEILCCNRSDNKPVVDLLWKSFFCVSPSRGQLWENPDVDCSEDFFHKFT